jgi:hypothetical protein
MAVVNLSAGLALSSRAERQTDLHRMRKWVTAWAVDGVDVYRPDANPSGYPPNALVTYAPLAIPTDDPARLWAVLNVAMAVAAAYLAVARFVHDRTFDAALSMAMFLWGGQNAFQLASCRSRAAADGLEQQKAGRERIALTIAGEA